MSVYVKCVGEVWIRFKGHRKEEWICSWVAWGKMCVSFFVGTKKVCIRSACKVYGEALVLL